MQESCRGQEEQIKDTDLYEGLTELIKIFKLILTTSETITSQIIKQQQCDKTIKHLKDVISQNEKQIHQYNSQLNQLSPHKNTYYRFVCRLIQNLEVYKNFFYKEHIINTIYVQFLNKIQVLIHSYKIDKNIGRVFQRIFQLTNKFCNSCQIIMNKGPQEEAIEYFSKKQITVQGPLEVQLQITKKNSFNSTESNFNKVKNELTKRFNPLSCLDLDYNSFKSCYFEAINDKKQLHKQMMHRNRLISSQIQIYSKKFQEYLKKKQRNIARKNRFKANQFNNTFTLGFKTKPNFNKTIDVMKINETQHEYMQKGAEKLQQLRQTKRNKFKDSQSPQQTFFDFQARKTTYQIKNVYLTLNKIHATTQFNQINFKSFHKYEKQPTKLYAIPKLLKYQPKSSKFSSQEKAQLNHTLLETVQLDFKNIKSKHQQAFISKKIVHSFHNPIQKITQPTLRHKMERRNFLQRKNIRITQLLKKNSLTSKIRQDKSLSGIQGIHIQGQNFIERDFL